MSYEDKTLVCRDCNEEFVFTAGEQQFHADKGFTNAPSRCPSCRSRRKATGGSGGGRSDFGGGYREMHDATCAECGAETQVPFVPNGSRPVYCSDCFRKQRANRW